MDEKLLNFVLIGRSGAGKGTQANLLVGYFKNSYLITTGNLCRDLALKNTDAGERVKNILAGGGLIYDDLATMLWMHDVSFNVGKNQCIIFDGAPRRREEAENMDRFLEFLERKDNTKILLIDIPREEAFKRLMNRRICKLCGMLVPFIEPYKSWAKCEKCGGELLERNDDNPDAINARLDYFDERVKEVIDYYKFQGRLIVINGSQSIENVHEEILNKIGG